VGLRIAVEKQERRPGAADPHVDGGVAGQNLPDFKAFEHQDTPLLLRRNISRFMTVLDLALSRDRRACSAKPEYRLLILA
jgi:hypothetical protein